MKSEVVKTSVFVVAAAILVTVAAWVEPEAARPEIFSDQGELLFPQFRDVMAVKAIEVVDYDETQAVARPLKVELRKGRWILPSHNDYPAEAGDRLSKTAAALLDLRKDLVVSDRIEDHAKYGVIDPLDAKVASLTGRGKHVTLRDERGEVLADMVLGKAAPEREGYRYVRLPGQKRTYAVKTDADPSARFEDWVEDNLLRLASSQVRKVTIHSYSIDEEWGRVADMQRIVLSKEGDNWKSDGDRAVSRGAILSLISALGEIRIVGARPKPRPLAEQLRTGRLEMTLEAVMSLRQRGFFLTPMGQLLANEGEVLVETSTGLLYTLRFGEIVSGASGAPAGDEAEEADTGEQDRYLFVTVSHDPAREAKYGGAGGERLARSLTARFADWYYVISGKDFAKLRPK
jgi:hypothetical protein